jgi:hypothetical protein
MEAPSKEYEFICEESLAESEGQVKAAGDRAFDFLTVEIQPGPYNARAHAFTGAESETPRLRMKAGRFFCV